MPARSWPPTFTAVSRAPHSSPLAYATCCMRESLALSLPFGGPKVALLWLATPATSTLQLGKITVSAMQSGSGRLPAGCVANGGAAEGARAIVRRGRAGGRGSKVSEEEVDNVPTQRVVGFA